MSFSIHANLPRQEESIHVPNILKNVQYILNRVPYILNKCHIFEQCAIYNLNNVPYHGLVISSVIQVTNPVQ